MLILQTGNQATVWLGAKFTKRVQAFQSFDLRCFACGRPAQCQQTRGSWTAARKKCWRMGSAEKRAHGAWEVWFFLRETVRGWRDGGMDGWIKRCAELGLMVQTQRVMKYGSRSAWSPVRSGHCRRLHLDCIPQPARWGFPCCRWLCQSSHMGLGGADSTWRHSCNPNTLGWMQNWLFEIKHFIHLVSLLWHLFTLTTLLKSL